VQEPHIPVTGPRSGGPERGTRASTRATGTQGAVGAILVVLALGLALRLIIAYLLPGSGFEADLASFRFWADNLAREGLYGFYERDFFHDYTPGYLYVLWLVGQAGLALGGIGDLIKVPPVLADLAIGWLVWSMVRELGVRDRLALGAALVAVLNPIAWFDSVVWGQVDSFGVVFLLLALRAMWRDQPERAAVFTVIAAIIKPQLGILVPLVAVLTIRRALWPVDDPATPRWIAEPGAGLIARVRAWETQTGRWWRILTTGVAGYLTAVVLCLPFGLSVLEPSGVFPFVSSGLVDQIVVAGGGYPYLTVNAYNVWAIVPGDTGMSLANAGVWVCDAIQPDASRCGAGVALFGVVPTVVVGAVLLLATMALILWVVARHPDRLTILVGLAVLALAFFAVPTRVHERYGFPFFAVGAILFAMSGRWRIAYVVLSAATFANMYVVLTTLYPDNPSISDWLGIGSFLRSEAGVVAAALAHTIAFVWALLQLRGGARATLEDELVASTEPPDPESAEAEPEVGSMPSPIPGAAVVSWSSASAAKPAAAPAGPDAAGIATPMAAAAVALPAWSPRRSFSEAGITGWLRDRATDLPIRPDRSASLHGERGGRFDRLDVWILLVLFCATLGLRTFRLAEPAQMHFDEVYHARTATEFLQGWRYDLDHDIYEWTHPHLAKYAMALGIMAWGEDDVSATSALGVPVRAAAHEPRREDVVLDDMAGERVHVATGDEIRTYDLRTRQVLGTVPAVGVGALAVDLVGEQLVTGADDGSITTLGLIALGLGPADEIVAPVPLTTLDHPIEQLLVSDDGTTLIAASSDTVTVVGAADGRVIASTPLDGVSDLAPGGSGSSLMVDPTAIEDPAAFVATLVELLGGDATEYEAALAQPTGEDGLVTVAPPGTGETRTKVQEAIDDGRLAGTSIGDQARIAVATSAGVTFLDQATGELVSTIETSGGAHGLARVLGVSDPKLYATTGDASDPGYSIISIGGDSAADGPVVLGAKPLPAPATWVTYDDASQMVHMLGRVPGSDGSPDDPWTVYVVQPQGNQDPALFADAALPADLVPSAWVTDVESQSMSDDRQQLLVFGGDGATASIEMGSHAFAWRLPGVIAGALMAVCLYLLARILFRRRLVAGLLAGFVLLEGMLFVQSRIGMNDVYVGLFIVAAYTLFAAVWTGWWSSRAAPWLAMPVVGLLLGLALASKWVAAYAIGALALLLLVRSALGRVVALLGMIAITSVLGYLAISVPEGQGIGNVAFLLIMIGLTLVGVIVAVNHPVAWTDAEQWFAVLAPAVAGTLVFFGAIATGRIDTVYTIGPVTITPLLAAIALASGSLVVAAVMTVGGRLGYGPLATPPEPDDPRSILPPPDAPPPDWLRPGWLAGLPIVFAAVCLVAIPLVVYVISYVPWAMIDGHQLWTGVPAGHTGQTLLELTAQMYGYHNGLTSPHPASSPYWAWPMDLKPVWFYQDGFAGGTTAAIYDAGNLVIWWLSIPAIIFAAVMAYRRKSLALAIITIGFAAQWVPWARIDRAAFQYHYYTALPFLLLAFAYFVAELWHGASRRTWLVARIAAGIAIVGPAVLWLFSRPLCWFVDVQSVNPGSQACPALIPELVVTVRSLGLLVVVIVGVIVLGRAILALGDAAPEADGEGAGDPRRTGTGPLRAFIVPAIGVAIGFAVAALLPETPVLTLTGIPVEPIALLVGLPLAYLAAQVLASRDAHRFVAGLLVAVLGWFVVWYPNIAALPLPSAIANAYQGFLPTYLYAFQFPVSTADRNVDAPLLSPTLAILTAGIGLTCLVVAYSASVWRLALAESATAARAPSSPDGSADGLARSGGGA
jgi:hypothetical protein